jgi:hypothetical protein
LFTGAAPADDWLERLGPSPGSKPDTWDREAARGAVARLIAAPESQLG